MGFECTTSKESKKSKKVKQLIEKMNQQDGEFFISKRPEEPLKLESTPGQISGEDNAELPRRGYGSDTSEGRTIFIRSVPFDADERSLYQFLSTFGELEFAKIVKDKMTNHSRGTAFAKFALKEDVDNILLKFSKSYVSFVFVFAFFLNGFK